jgi:primosomal protein N' (replication factor Y)
VALAPTTPTPATPAPAAGPVARVAVDVPLAHLDRFFDYAVPADLDDRVVPGCRVRVRFAGRLVDGYVVERAGRSGHTGRLTPLARCVSSEPVLAPEVAALARMIADRYAGSLADVLRLAVPPRHARVEAQPSPAPAPPPSPPQLEWPRLPPGGDFLAALGAGAAPRAVWQALPGDDWPGRVAAAAQATLAAGRGVVIVVPDHRDVARVDAALVSVLGAGQHVVLSADLGPAERYRRWLAVRRGSVRCALGTRSSAFAPVHDLGLVVCWDDGDDLHKEPRAPYPHVRDVLVLRAHQAGAAALLGGLAVTCEALQLVDRGWAQPLAAPRVDVRAAAPVVHVAGTDADQARDPAARAARLPTAAWEAAGRALAAHTPVLVQVPRAGYQPTLACDSCRSPARCVQCSGPLGRQAGASAPACRWCGRPAADWSCPTCGRTRLRSAVTGSRRTAEELGRSFPGVAVRTSDRDHVLAAVPPGSAVVVATPGAEPVVDGGYGAVLLLDGAALLARADLRAGEEALRRWLAAAALARPAHQGGEVVIMADSALPAVQALVRWDPAGFARRELDERVALAFPPAVRMAAVDGPPDAIADLLAVAELPPSAQVLGPVPYRDGERALVRCPRVDGAALAAGLHAALGVRSARKAAEPVRVELDPLELV